MLDFRIQTFLVLCETRSYTKTAELLHITQPAVTQHIKYLEAQYATRFFTYHRKKLELTEPGRLFEHIATTMRANCETARELLRSAAGPKAHLRFAATLTVGEFVLPGMLEQYMCVHPEVFLTMLVENTAAILDHMRRGVIDFGVVEGYFSKTEFDCRLLRRDRFLAVCGSDCPLGRAPCAFTDLLGEHLVIREPGSGTREIFERVLQENNLTFADFPSVSEIANLNVIKYFVSRGRGITFMYESAVRQELQSGSLREIHIYDLSIEREYNFVVLKDSVFREKYEHILFDEIYRRESYN